MKISSLEIYKKKDSSPLETEGVWFEINENVKFKLRMFGGSNLHNIQKWTTQLSKPYVRLIQNGDMDEDVQNRLNVKIFYKSCIVDWDIVEDDGSIVECNEENAITLFIKHENLLATVMHFCEKIANFKEIEREELGNS